MNYVRTVILISAPITTFYGLFPEDGALREQMNVSARNCFPLPATLGDEVGPLLETLGVAIHAIDLSKIRVASTVAVLGAGPGRLTDYAAGGTGGAHRRYVAFDKFDWRVRKAREWGATHAFNVDECDPVGAVMDVTGGRGVDVAIEAAWADRSVQQAAEMSRPGGRLVLVGIAADDKLEFKHSVARRKGLTIMMSRRMKHTYPRAIDLATSGKVKLEELVSHCYDLSQTAQAYARNAAYEPGINKVILRVN